MYAEMNTGVAVLFVAIEPRTRGETMGLFNKAKDTDKMAKDHQDQSSQAMDQDQYRDQEQYQDQYEDQYQDEDHMQGQRQVRGQGSGRDQGLDPSDAQDDEQDW